jgi:spore coat protein SA
MRIALINASPSPIPATLGGATETMMTHLIDVNEDKKLHEFTIFSYFENRAAEEAKKYKHTSFYFYHPNTKWDNLCGLYWRIFRKLTNERLYVRSNFINYCAGIINQSCFDVVILEGNCFQVQQMRKLIKNKIILHMHIDRLNNELKSTKRMIDASDGLFAISEFCKGRMAEVDPRCRDKVIVLKNTIDTEKFTYRGDVERQKMRERFKVMTEQKLIFYCGRVDPTKGVLELVKALKLLDDENLRLIVIGSSVYQNSKKSDYIKKLERVSADLKGGVVFTGYIQQNELPKYISGCDIAIVPSICQEAAGNVIIEALGCGVPVIATTQGGIPEYADKKACRLVKVDDQFVKNLAKQIHELAYNEPLYTTLKEHAREVALQYDKHNYYSNFSAAVKNVLNL